MSFLDKLKYTKKCSPTIKTKNKKNNSLQAQKFKINAYTGIFYSHNPKRTSPITFRRVNAGVSIEAAIAIPVFLFFIINVIAIIGFFNSYGEALSKVQQQARVEAFNSNNINDNGNELIICSKQIDLSPFIASLSFEGSSTTASITYRKWNGYDVANSQAINNPDEYVYITEHGTSYHMNRDCRHLKVTILIADSNDIVNKRNESGSKYTPCEKCGGNGTGVVFYTPDGNRYHARANCSGLKRTILTVRLSEVGGRKACKSCK